MRKLLLPILAALIVFFTAAFAGQYNPPPVGTAGSAASLTVPSGLAYLGDGSDGAYVCTPGPTCLVANGGEYWYTDFTVAVGQTVTYSPAVSGYPNIIRATGTCTIAGTLTVGPNQTNAGNYGGGGGAGGGGTLIGAVGGRSLALPNNGGTAGNAGGGAGGNGTGIDVHFQRMIATNTLFMTSDQTQSSHWAIGGAIGGAGGSAGPAGNYGAGALVLACNSINFTGTINAIGLVGRDSTGNNVGASGGGGGGIVILRAPTLTNTGTINLGGGAGGSCLAFTGCGVGGTGGAGWSYVLSK